MTDQELLKWAKHQKEQQKKHYTRYAAKQKILRRKAEGAKIEVTQAEIDAELKKK